MTDRITRRPAAGGGALPIAKKERESGFTKKKRKLFLATLATSCNVVASCRRAKISASTVYQTRKVDAEFRRDWEEAVREGYAKLEMVMLDRAIRGCRKTVWYAGKKVGSDLQMSDQLGLTLLAKHRPVPEAVPDTGDTDPAAAIRVRIEAKIEAVRKRLHVEDQDA